MPGRVTKATDFCPSSDHGQIIKAARSETRPHIDQRQAADDGRNLQRVRRDRVHARARHTFIKTGVLGRRSGEEATVHARHDVTARAIYDMTKWSLQSFKAEHLPAHRFDANYGGAAVRERHER